MADQRVIAVFGSTGAQGGGLARAILADSEQRFSVRAIARDPSSPKARELARLGAEVVAADVDDRESVERALDGAYGAFFITFFWHHLSPARETAEAREFALAARSTGVRHAIWSTLEDTRRWVPLSDERMPTLRGKYKVPHCDGKGESDRLFSDLGVPTTWLLTSFYWESLIHFGLGPRPGADGHLVFSLPMADQKLPGIDSEDIGRCALGIFKRGPALIGKTIGIAGEHLTGAQMAAAFTEALGRGVRYEAVTPEAFRALEFVGAEELGNMFQFHRDFEDYVCAARSIDSSRSLNPEMQTFAAWLDLNKERFPLG
jgi:uncharacterized protein YbjT (DUF2867 family)